ncbi:hypothetical protein COHA_004054 [Chlorella ohadii]|uniref:Uncharacterized protein n=1 Tax=Chlorella ohadii TaxID=2649997 RepID=A0AAD5DUM8_9CHLO|nr:hypothetical protein COHA_004054 [Chlorella ohadii]
MRLRSPYAEEYEEQPVACASSAAGRSPESIDAFQAPAAALLSSRALSAQPCAAISQDDHARTSMAPKDYDADYEKPNELEMGAIEEVPLQQLPDLFVTFGDPAVQRFECGGHRAVIHMMRFEGVVPGLTDEGRASYARNCRLLAAFQAVKNVRVRYSGKAALSDGLELDEQRPRFNLNSRIKKAAFKAEPQAKPIYDYLVGCLEHFAADRGWKLVAIKILEDGEEDWPAPSLRQGCPQYFRIFLHLPLGPDTQTGLVLAAGKGAAAPRIWISDEQGRVALGGDSFLLSAGHSVFNHAAAARGHCLCVTADFDVC